MKKTDHRIPDLYYNSIWEIDFNRLKEKGISNLIIDVDNTIAIKGELAPVNEARQVLKKLLEDRNNWNICLVSNIVMGKKREDRVKKIAESLKVPYVAAWLFEMKPGPKPFLKALEILGSTAENTAVIGDQMFTDVVGGNRLGLFTVMVKPLGPDHWLTTMSGKRKIENHILKKTGII